MIKEAFNKDECNKYDESLDKRRMFILSLATSIDAMIVGVTFAFLEVNIFLTMIMIGIITFTLSFLGVKLGHKFGEKYKSRSELLGGIVLVLLGIKILLEHLNII